MRTLKPFALTALNAPFQHNGKVRLVVVAAAMVSLDGTRIEHEQALWMSLADLPGSSGGLDEIRPKVRGEALALGYAFPPGGKPAPVVAARLSVGPINKEIWVVGDRQWKTTGPTEAVPFTQMPLGYDRAFGGEGYAPNPSGKGYAPIKTESGDTVHPMPNVEIAKKLITSPRDRPAPAGFGPLDPSWPQRAKKGGTYDKKWVETKYPEMADDFDPTYFNVAPDDQWIDGYWEGGEPFVLENMHPERPRIEGVVPSLRARCFVARRGDPVTFEEAALRCDTLWFVPHKERIIMVFRGGVDVADEDAPDVEDILFALERKDAPRERAHYFQVRAMRLDKDRGPLYTLRDADLTPDDIELIRSPEVGEMDGLIATEGLTAKNAQRRSQRELDKLREQLATAGVDPDKHLPKTVPEPPPPPDPNKLPEMIEDIDRQVEAAKIEADVKRDRMLADLREVCKQQGVDIDSHVKPDKPPPGGPVKFDAEAQIKKLKDLLEQAKAQGGTLPPNAAAIDDPKMHDKLRQAESAMKEGYRRSAHYQIPAATLDEPESARVRRDIEAAVAARASLKERDLTGADLSGIDFSGCDLSGSFMEKTNLRGCKFKGANVEKVVFARADLRGADFDGARVRGANFGESDLTGAKLTGGLDLTEVVFMRANLQEADLSGAVLDGADLSEARCQKTVLSKVRAKRLMVLDADLSGLDLRESELVECNLLRVNLTGADLSGAKLEKTALLDVKADEARFRGARLDNFRVVSAEKGSSMKRADLRGVTMRAANLRGIDLEGVDLREADVVSTDFSGANMRGANLEGARAVEGRFMKTDLTDAVLARSDLMNALLGGAIVRGATFEEANVFRADAAKMKGDDKTSFKGANVKQVRIVPDRNTDG